MKKMARCQSIFNLSADNLRLVELCAGVLLGVLSLKSVLLGVLRQQKSQLKSAGFSVGDPYPQRHTFLLCKKYGFASSAEGTVSAFETPARRKDIRHRRNTRKATAPNAMFGADFLISTIPQCPGMGKGSFSISRAFGQWQRHNWSWERFAPRRGRSGLPFLFHSRYSRRNG